MNATTPQPETGWEQMSRAERMAAIDARQKARDDLRLNRSMLAFFDWVIDQALNPSFFDCRGVVTISDPIAAERFRVSDRSIYTWKKTIEASGHFWISKKYKSNMWPITTYHLTCLHKPRNDQKTDSDGTYGGGRLRSSPANPGPGARKPGQPQLPLPGSRQSPPDTKSAEMQGTSALNGKTLRPTAEENFGSEPKKISGLSRRQLRSRAEENFGSEPKTASGESRSPIPPPPEANCEHIKTQVRDGVAEIGGKQPPPPEAAQEERLKEEDAKWRARMEKLFDRERNPIQDELVAQRKQTPPGPVRDYLSDKIAFLKRIKLGPLPSPAPTSPKVVETEQPQPPRASPAALAALKEAAR